MAARLISIFLWSFSASVAVWLAQSAAALSTSGVGERHRHTPPDVRSVNAKRVIAGRSSLSEALPPGALARFGSIHLRQPALTWSLAVSPTGGIAASTSRNWACQFGLLIRLWDIASGKELPALRGHTFEPHKCVFSPDGKLLASSARSYPRRKDSTARVWDLVSKKEILCLPGGGDIAFSPDGKVLLAADDGLVGMYEIPSGRLLYRGKGGPACAFLPAGGTIAVGSSNGTVSLIDRMALRERVRLTARSGGEVYALAASRDGKQFAAVAGTDLNVWDITSGNLVWSKQLITSPTFLLFTPNGREVLFSQGNALCWWDARTGKELFKIQATALALSPDEKSLAIFAEGSVKVVDIGTRKVLRQCPGGEAFQTTPQTFQPAVGGLCANGRRLVAACDNAIRIVDLATGDSDRSVAGHWSDVVFAAFSHDGRQVVSAGDNTIRFWDVQTGKEMRRLVVPGRRVRAVSMTSDRKRLWADSFGPVCFWELTTGRQIGCHDWSKKGPRLTLLHPAGAQLAVWSGAELEFMHPITGVQLARLPAGSEMLTGAFSPDGTRLVVRGPDLSVIRIDGPKPVLEWNAPLPPVLGQTGVACTPDGRIALTSIHKAGDGGFLPPELVALYETASGTRITELRGHEASVGAFAASPDGKVLATGGWDGKIRLWELASGRELTALTGHRGGITCVAFSSDGKRLLSGGSDTVVLLWDVARLTASRPWPIAKVGAKEYEQLWADLLSKEAGRAYAALWKWLGSGQQGLAYLKAHYWEKLPTRTRFDQLVRQLDAPSHRLREQATRELVTFGSEVKPRLEKLLAGSRSLEMRRRFEQILAQLPTSLQGPTPAQLRAVRIVQLLEYLGTAETRQLLRELAAQDSTSLVGRQAANSLRRLTNP